MSKSRSSKNRRRSRSREDSDRKRKRHEKDGKHRKKRERSRSSEDSRRKDKARNREDKKDSKTEKRREKDKKDKEKNRKKEKSEKDLKKDRKEDSKKELYKDSKREKETKNDRKDKYDRSDRESKREKVGKSPKFIKQDKKDDNKRVIKRESKEDEKRREIEKDREKRKDQQKEKLPEASKDKDEKPTIKRPDADAEAEIKKKKEEEAARKKREIEEEQKIILEAMENERRKRRQRIDDWRQKIKKEFVIPESTEKPAKTWNLEDENDPDDENAPRLENAESILNSEKSEHLTKFSEQNIETNIKKVEKNVENLNLNPNQIKTTNKEISIKDNEKIDNKNNNEEIDPLDAFMMELKESIKDQQENIKTVVHQEEEEQPAIIHTIVNTPKNKGKDVEILEQFGDAAEYSSEEEEEEETPTDIPKRNLKVIPAIDHNKVYYRAFRKNFYIEVPEIAKMTDQEVAAYRVELGNVVVKGKGCPKPIKKWVQIGANPIVLEVLKKSNFVNPTAIQAQAIPAIMSGRDVISIARTGSGKTLAFLLPMFRHVLDQPAMVEGDGPIAIILTPTRELAVQIYKDCRKFTKHLGLKAICLYGGSVVSEQIAELKRGAEIAICTPGRLIDMLSVNGGKITNCRRCTFLVLDEADRMFDLGFEPQVQKILEQIRPDRQICLFTATFSLSMEALARRVLHKPLEILVGKRNKVCTDVKQHLLLLESENKFLKLLELLGIYSDAGRILIFVERQDAADDLLKDLMTKGYPCMSIHGGRDQYDRDSSLSDFKSGVTNILVATSVAARGIDVKNIALVINYDCPNHGEDYVHRCGRTGRAGNKGTAITFITPKDAKYLKDILTVVENTNCEISQSIINLYQNYNLSDKNRRIKSSGFSGRGFKFDDREMLHAAEQKKMLKWTFGWQDERDEAEEETKVLKKIEQSIERSFGNRPKMGAGSIEDSVDKDKAELAKSIASKLNQKLKPTEQSDALSRLVRTIPKPKPESLPAAKNIELAKEIAEKLNVKINPEHVKTQNKPETRKLTAGEVFFEEIDINDFPQLARQRISTKETLDAVAEMSDCCLTIRGSYCPGGKPLDFTDRRLHLLIEGKTEFKVQIAKAEVKRIIKEESVKSDFAFIQPSSRYRIV